MGAAVREQDTGPVTVTVRDPGVVIDRILEAGEVPPPDTPPRTVFLQEQS